METRQIAYLLQMIAVILVIIGIILILITTGVMVNVGWGLLIVGIIVGVIGFYMLKM